VREVDMRAFLNVRGPHNIVFNWRGAPVRDLQFFALGYKEAAGHLAASFVASRAHADYEGYPILYLYRHSLELYLKAVIFRAGELLGFVGKGKPVVQALFGSHSLLKLLPALRVVSKALHWNFKYEGSELKSFSDFEQLLKMIEKMDACSYSFRYPVDGNGSGLMPRHTTINVASFAKVMNSLLDFLEGAVCQIENKWDAAVESARELQRLLTEDDAT
jgi:hypothetical protein